MPAARPLEAALLIMLPPPPPPPPLASRTLLAVDDLLTDLAVDLVAAVGRARHVSPQYLALAVPGLCHTHTPCLRASVPGCAYCARRGNCFSR